MVLPSSFNEQQQKDFVSICSDFDGQTSTGYVLEVMYRVMWHYKARLLEVSPDFDIDDDELSDEVAVCVAACAYFQAKQLLEDK